MWLIELDMKTPDERLELHLSISQLVQRIHVEAVALDDADTIQRTAFLLNSGSLNYWLSNFADICRARWETTKNSVFENKFDFPEFASCIEQLALPSMFTLNAASQDPVWNAALERLISVYQHDSYLVLQHKRSQSATLHSEVRTFSETPVIGNSVRIFTSYLPRAVEALVSFRLGSIPRRWREPKLETAKIDFTLRNAISFRDHVATTGTFEHFLRALLPYLLPHSVVENLEAICDTIPDFKVRIPRAVFTANLHVSSDSFVIWMAHIRSKGTKVLLSQHGGLNGQGRIPTRGEEFETHYADKYLNWGWYEAPNSRRFPTQITLCRRRRKSSNHRKELLIITDCTYRLSRRPWADSLDNERYRSMLLSTYAGIPPSTKRHAIVRLHHDHAKYDESHRTMWMQEFEGVRLDDGVSRINSLRRRSRLVICTTLGTSEIEQFAGSIPTVLRIDPYVHALRDSCSGIFGEMESVGIVHWSTQSLTNFLEANFEDIDTWWSSTRVQFTVNSYLALFGHQSRSPIRDVVEVLGDRGD